MPRPQAPVPALRTRATLGTSSVARMSFRALVVEQTRDDRGRITAHEATVRDVDDDFIAADGPVEIDIAFCDINYKDAMALTGRPGILRSTPIIPGIDLVGTVRAVDAQPQPGAGWQPGDTVVLTGEFLGERRNGGLAQRARVPGEHLVRVPDALTPRQAAAIGTAGVTAALCVLALEDAGVGKDAPVAVSGATGGVGSVAVALLAARGYEVAAISGRADAAGEYLRGLGAAAILDRAEFEQPGAPLQQRRFAGAVDTAGSRILVNLLAQTTDGGTVAACGLAAGADLPGSVMPFILRGVHLAGVNSVTAPLELRKRVWALLAEALPAATLDAVTTEVTLDEAVPAAEQLMAGRHRGRTVVRLH